MSGKFSHNARKAAILVGALDRETADQLLSALDEAQHQLVLQCIASMDDVTSEEQQAVIEEFLRAGATTQSGEPGYADLNPSTAPRASAESGATAGRPFDFLSQVQGENLTALLADEHPQTIALVMASVAPRRAAEVLESLPSDVQVDVVRRLVDLHETDAAIVQEVERGLKTRLEGIVQTRQRKSAGLAAVTHILELADHRVEKHVLEHVARVDRQLASRLSRQLLDCARLEDLDDDALVDVFQSAETSLAVLALTGSSHDLIERVLRCLPAMQSRQLRGALDHLGPTRLADVESARQELLDRARRRGAAGSTLGSIRYRDAG